VKEIRPGPARFDAVLGAWILSRHADVGAALSDPALTAPGEVDGAATAAVRSAVKRTFAKRLHARWRERMEASAVSRFGALAGSRPVDLMGDFAEPWCLDLAIAMTGARPEDAGRLAGLSRRVFLGAARATAPGSGEDAGAAATELARELGAGGGAGDPQTFVAVAETLPCVLTGAWHVLLEHPAVVVRLRDSPALVPSATEELLRLGNPSRVVFREAREPADRFGVRIGAGDRVILALAAANRDPARFADPDRCDPDRDAAGHFAFGGAPHACPGAALVRIATSIATATLLAGTRQIEPAGAVAWRGGFAIRSPGLLPVVLRPR
jgi:cytochrome P450